MPIIMILFFRVKLKKIKMEGVHYQKAISNNVEINKILNDYANKNNVILYLNEKDKEDYPFF